MVDDRERHPLVSSVCVFFLLLVFLVAGACTFFLSHGRVGTAASVGANVVPRVILDAGHGGEDGGAVGVNGALEKDLNLAVTMQLAELLREAGVEVILTRTEDKLLYTEEENIKGHRKEYDLKNRLAFGERDPDALFISIHMNTFSVPKYSGLQVYYAAGEPSRRLADTIQRRVRDGLQPENRRTTKFGGDGLYLLENAHGCAVLVECGFLSNPDECARLSEKDYQRELCFSIFCGIMEYIKDTGG